MPSNELAPGSCRLCKTSVSAAQNFTEVAFLSMGDCGRLLGDPSIVPDRLSQGAADNRDQLISAPVAAYDTSPEFNLADAFCLYAEKHRCAETGLRNRGDFPRAD